MASTDYDANDEILNRPVSQNKRLDGRTSRFTGNAAAGCGCVSFISAFLLAGGTGLILLANGTFTLKGVSAPPFVPGSAGVSLVVAGLLVLGGAIHKFLAYRLRQSARESYPNEPWRFDRAWDHSGETHSFLRESFSAFFAAAFMILFMTPFNWWGIYSKDSVAFAWLFIGIFDLITLGVAGLAFYTLFRHVKYGTSRVTFERFPYFLGEKLNATLHTGRSIGAFNKMTITLRCVYEKHSNVNKVLVTNDYDEIQRLKRRSRQSQAMEFVEYFADTLTIDQSGVSETKDIPLSFDLPSGGKSTNLESLPCYYWEIEVTADTPGVDYNAVFLVPVYKKPAL